jgi:hypothetical protein
MGTPYAHWPSRERVEAKEEAVECLLSVGWLC